VTGLAGKTILIAEDEPLIALDLCETLQDAGAVTLVFAACVDALQCLRSNTPDLAIVDNGLADGPSDELCVELKRLHVPIIICSGQANDDVAHLSDHVVMKPAQPQVILNKAVALLANQSLKT
jgi:DNA-binding response OmpR family regulator